jgi:AraC-like DNA-binding protein
MLKQNNLIDSDFKNKLKENGFIVYEVNSEDYEFKHYDRRAFYKICLMTGDHLVQYSDRTLETNGTILFFGNPHIPYSWEIRSKQFGGFTCLFSEELLMTSNLSQSLQESPLFKLGGTPIFNVTEKQKDFISIIFNKMIEDSKTEYSFKMELMRNCIQMLIHEALRMQAFETFDTKSNASIRITNVFNDLLERQFPIENSEQPLQLKTPIDFANGMHIHVNSLNRAVKETTGKTTTELITERVVTEARILLQHTNWDISEIAYSLGFEYPTYFNTYFKKMTGVTPTSIRKS